jgi:TPR repeat protein
MLFLRSALAVAILVAAGCSVEPTQINPPPSAQHQQSYINYYRLDEPDPIERGPDQTVVTYADSASPALTADGSQFVDTAPQAPRADLLALANQAKAAGDDASYVSYLKSAAEQGSADAHHDLAKVYTNGKIVPRDLDAAAGHLRSSAGLGNPEAL